MMLTYELEAFFSLDFFSWGGKEEDRSISPYLWIYVLATAVLTAVTVGLFYVCILRRNKTKDKEESEFSV